MRGDVFNQLLVLCGGSILGLLVQKHAHYQNPELESSLVILYVYIY